MNVLGDAWVFTREQNPALLEVALVSSEVDVALRPEGAQSPARSRISSQ